jgi:hypothetical protein
MSRTHAITALATAAALGSASLVAVAVEPVAQGTQGVVGYVGLSAPLSTTELDGDMVHVVFAEGLEAVVPAGSTLEFGEKPSTDPELVDGVEAWASVTPPSDFDSVGVDAIQLAQQAGMFSEEDAADMSNSFTDSANPDEPRSVQACLDIDTSLHWAHGCYSRKEGRTARWWGTSSNVSGDAKGLRSTERVKTGHKYNSTTEVRRWEPDEDRSAGSCTNQSFGFEYQGIKWTGSGQVCPAKIHPWFENSGHTFKSQWQAGIVGVYGTRKSIAKDAVYRSGASTGFSYWIGIESLW